MPIQANRHQHQSLGYCSVLSMENRNPIFLANPHRDLYGRQSAEDDSEKGRSAKAFEIAYVNTLRDFFRQLMRREDKRAFETKPNRKRPNSRRKAK